MENQKQYYIVRSSNAGVFAGYIEEEHNDTVIMNDVRRLWYWSGAASLSQLSKEGVKNPQSCKFPCEVKRLKIFNVIEIIEATEKAMKSIAGVEIWEI